MKNKVLNAIQEVESCKMAYYKPEETLESVIYDLIYSVGTM